MSFDPREG